MHVIDSVLEVPLHLEGDAGAFSVSTSSRRLEDGLFEVGIVLQAEQPATLPDLSLKWEWPSSDIHSHWRPLLTVGKAVLDPNAARVHSRANGFPPVSCLLSQDGRNRLTVACGEVVHGIDIAQGPSERPGMMSGRVRLVSGARPATQEACWTVRFDRRNIPFEQALREVSQWWETLPGCAPAPVPDAATLPVYSTWCAFWQEPDPEPVLADARLARDLGCGTLILDDGWQTMNANQAYAYCGDWENERMGDMKRFVASVHELGMKCLLWYPIALVGYESKVWERFAGKVIRDEPGWRSAMLDPRFPDVRSYHADTYERAMREWNLDGLKIDFGDAITSQKPDSAEAKDGRDIASLPEAVAELFDEVYRRAVAVRPDALIEYKLGYHGPRMRAACNFIRSSDCKNDSLTDRVHIVDLRLLAGSTVIHADTIDWHADEPVESAALHVLHVLFSVPQLSMRLQSLPPEHHEMLRFWLGWWKEHRRTLLGGELFGLDPATNYPVAQARGEDGHIAAVYADAVVRPGETSGPLHIVNGTLREGVVLDCATPLGTRRAQIYDCRGRLVVDEERAFDSGLLRLEIPAAGLATLEEIEHV